MKKILFTILLVSLSMLNIIACASAPEGAPTATSVPLTGPSPTMTPFVFTPPPSAFAPGPTAAPLEDILASYTVNFDAADGTVLSGELYGSGKTAVIFSVMGNCKPGWREFAQLTAAQGLMALTYQWRGCRNFRLTNENELRNFVDDARGAIDFVRAQGADKIILAGASLGGLASAKLAIESQASGIVVVASPPGISDWGFEIEAADLETDIPKLFITAEHDTTVPASRTRQLYDLAAEPKEWQIYPGYEHGTDLFWTESGEEMRLRILEFILTIASKN